MSWAGMQEKDPVCVSTLSFGDEEQIFSVRVRAAAAGKDTPPRTRRVLRACGAPVLRVASPREVPLEHKPPLRLDAVVGCVATGGWKATLTVEHVDVDGLRLCVGRVALVASGVRRLRRLDQEETRGGRSFLRDHAHSPARAVVADYLQKITDVVVTTNYN